VDVNILKLYQKVQMGPLSEEEEQWLLEQSHRYPYCPLILQLIASSFGRKEHPHTTKYLKLAALTSPDRAKVGFLTDEKLRTAFRIYSQVPNLLHPFLADVKKRLEESTTTTTPKERDKASPVPDTGQDFDSSISPPPQEKVEQKQVSELPSETSGEIRKEEVIFHQSSDKPLGKEKEEEVTRESVQVEAKPVEQTVTTEAQDVGQPQDTILETPAEVQGEATVISSIETVASAHTEQDVPLVQSVETEIEPDYLKTSVPDEMETPISGGAISIEVEETLHHSAVSEEKSEEKEKSQLSTFSFTFSEEEERILQTVQTEEKQPKKTSYNEHLNALIQFYLANSRRLSDAIAKQIQFYKANSPKRQPLLSEVKQSDTLAEEKEKKTEEILKKSRDEIVIKSEKKRLSIEEILFSDYQKRAERSQKDIVDIEEEEPKEGGALKRERVEEETKWESEIPEEGGIIVFLEEVPAISTPDFERFVAPPFEENLSIHLPEESQQTPSLIQITSEVTEGSARVVEKTESQESVSELPQSSTAFMFQEIEGAATGVYQEIKYGDWERFVEPVFEGSLHLPETRPVSSFPSISEQEKIVSREVTSGSSALQEEESGKQLSTLEHIQTEDFKRFVMPEFGERAGTLSGSEEAPVETGTEAISSVGHIQTEDFKRFVMPEFGERAETLSGSEVTPVEPGTEVEVISSVGHIQTEDFKRFVMPEFGERAGTLSGSEEAPVETGTESEAISSVGHIQTEDFKRFVMPEFGEKTETLSVPEKSPVIEPSILETEGEQTQPVVDAIEQSEIPLRQDEEVTPPTQFVESHAFQRFILAPSETGAIEKQPIPSLPIEEKETKEEEREAKGTEAFSSSLQVEEEMMPFSSEGHEVIAVFEEEQPIPIQREIKELTLQEEESEEIELIGEDKLLFKHKEVEIIITIDPDLRIFFQEEVAAEQTPTAAYDEREEKEVFQSERTKEFSETEEKAGEGILQENYVERRIRELKRELGMVEAKATEKQSFHLDIDPQKIKNKFLRSLIQQFKSGKEGHRHPSSSERKEERGEGGAQDESEGEAENSVKTVYERFRSYEQWLKTHAKELTRMDSKIEFGEMEVAENKVRFVTETLAQLYVRKGEIDKAIAVYQQLCLQYPEKKPYFETQIQKLKAER
jgi:hypothetical protein